MTPKEQFNHLAKTLRCPVCDFTIHSKSTDGIKYCRCWALRFYGGNNPILSFVTADFALTITVELFCYKKLSTNLYLMPNHTFIIKDYEGIHPIIYKPIEEINEQIEIYTTFS